MTNSVITVAQQPPRKWIVKVVLDYPDRVKPVKPYEETRHIAIGIRDDGQVYRLIFYTSYLMFTDHVERAKLQMVQDLDQFLTHPGYSDDDTETLPPSSHGADA
jgi:hypothetical protein